jgi:ribosome modulation factor
MFEREAIQPFSVTSYQLGLALHSYLTCPIRHVPAEDCPRLVRMVSDARSVLERATQQPLVPGFRGGVDPKSQQALPYGWKQESLESALLIPEGGAIEGPSTEEAS